MKKKIAILVLMGILMALPTVSLAAAAEGTPDNPAGREECEEVHGSIGCPFAEAGGAIEDAWEDLFGEGSEEGQEVWSFIQFQGGLQPPSGEGLDPTLTRTRDLREFIRNTVNLVLSFLGIIAMAVVIYGGFLYVTAAGNEEQSGKGKKAITYAAIGIVVIVISFALVNTLIRYVGTSGTDTGTEEDQRAAGVDGADGADGSDGYDGSGGRNGGTGFNDPNFGTKLPTKCPPGDTLCQLGFTRGPRGETGAAGETGQTGATGAVGPAGLDGISGGGATTTGTNYGQRSIYQIAAATVNGTIQEFAGAYRNLVAIKTFVKKVSELDEPNQQTSIAEKRVYFSAIKNALKQMKNNTHPLSKTHMIIRKIIDQWVSEIERRDLKKELEKPDGWKSFKEFSLEIKGKDFEQIKLIIGGQKENLKGALQYAAELDFQETIDEFIGTDKKKGRFDIVSEILGEIADQTAKTYISRGFKTKEDIERALAGLDPTLSVRDLFDSVNKNLANSRSGLVEDPDDIQLFAETTRSLMRLSYVLRNIEFVRVRIKSTVREGNAPLIVEFNGLDSRDPTGDTIEDTRYEWDPGSTTGVDCGGKGPDDLKKPIMVCTYEQAGTYIVSLKVVSSDPTRIASGKAYYPVTVFPNVARIALNARIGEAVKEEIRKYEKDNKGYYKLTLDKSEFQATRSEAKDPGLTFDASGSEPGGSAQLKNFSWAFSDGSQIEEGPAVKNTIKHAYKKEGRYPLHLKVTDTSNREDRKILNIVIATIAARVQVNKTVAEPDELVEFDGSMSRSDKGAITSYEWNIYETSAGSEENITNNTDKVTLSGNTNSSTLRAKFKKPGAYRVSLKVSDGSEVATYPSDNKANISVKSRRPRANFSIRGCPESCVDTTRPSVIEVNAGGSFDPDGDELEFEWKVFGKNGDELTAPINDGASLNIDSCHDNEPKKICMVFNDTGTYKIQLTATDKIAPSLQQQDVKLKDTEIKSVVEARWDDGITTVAKLDDKKEAAFTFTGSVRNATRAFMDFGDGDDGNELELEGEKFEFTHKYSEAGTFLVTLKAVSDEGKGENTIMKRVHVGSGEAPLSVMKVTVDGSEVVLPDPTPENPNPALSLIRNKVVKFDASESINTDGKPDGLDYDWNFGDLKQSTNTDPQHSYSDVSPDGSPFTVRLTVTEDSSEKTGTAKFLINVQSQKPQIANLSVEKKSQGNVTPIDVEVTAEGASDADGRITNYQFWYFSAQDREQKLGVIDTTSNSATLTIETAGEEAQEREYMFCASATDNENTVSECKDLWQDSELPKIKVKNGPNKAPVAAFTADRTSVRVGETFTLTSSSTDEDGKVVSYIWDVEGDGFQNNNPSELATITHKYEKKSPSSGYRVKLKVMDDKGAAGFSKEIPINVAAKSNDPQARFTYQVQTLPARRVKFFDDSKADRENGAQITKWTWDFDTSAEIGCGQEPRPDYCNGDKTDDIDSEDQNPIFDYPGSGSYQVKLTVEDSDGNTAESRALINVLPGFGGGTGGGSPTANVLRAELTSDPPAQFITTPTGDKRKIITFPASSNGELVTFKWGQSAGDILEYRIDKNTWCDSDGKGNQADDIDFIFTDSSNAEAGSCQVSSTGAPSENCWTTKYLPHARTQRSKLGRFNALLTVEDHEHNIATDVIEVRFGQDADRDGKMDGIDETLMMSSKCDGSPQEQLPLPLGGNLFKKLGPQYTILIGLVSGVIVVLLGYGIAGISVRGRKRV